MGEGIAFLEGFGIRLGEWGSYLLMALCAISCLGYLAFAHFHFKAKPNWLMAVLFLFLGVGNTVALCLFPSLKEGVGNVMGTTFNVVYSLADASRVRYILSFFVSCLFFYVLWGIAPKCLRNDGILDVLLIGGVLFFLSSIVYSWVAEWSFYQSCFTTGEATPLDHCLRSFTNNPNTFGCFMLYGVASLGVLQSRRHHWFNYVLMLVFTFQTLLIFSKTCLIILFLYWIFFLFYRFFATVKAHPWRSSILFGCGLVFMIALPFFWHLMATKSPNGFFGKSWHSLINFFPGEEAPTLFSRVATWNNCFSQYKTPLDILFGFGDQNALWYLGQVENYNVPDYCFSHNGFLLQFFTGGVLRVAIYIFLLGYALYSYIKGFARRQKALIPLFVGLIVFLIHGFAETTSLLEIDTKGILGTMILVLPLLVGNEAAKRKTLQISLIPLPKKSCKTYVSYLAFAPIGAFCSLAPAVFSFAGLNASSWIVSLVGFFLFLLVPLLANLFAREDFVKTYLPLMVFAVLVYFALFSISFLCPLEQKISDFVLLVSLSVCVYSLPFFLPPFCRLGAPRLYSLGCRIEEGLARMIGWIQNRNAKAEERYYSKIDNPKSRDKLHY